MERESDLIFGVYDKTRGVGGCDDYFGYFKTESGAKKELKTQFNYLKTKNPDIELLLKKDRVVRIKNGEEQIIIIIHPILLR
jgi:hypothetical protein